MEKVGFLRGLKVWSSTDPALDPRWKKCAETKLERAGSWRSDEVGRMEPGMHVGRRVVSKGAGIGHISEGISKSDNTRAQL